MAEFEGDAIHQGRSRADKEGAIWNRSSGTRMLLYRSANPYPESDPSLSMIEFDLLGAGCGSERRE